MKFIVVIAVTVFIEKSCSQILAYSDCPSTGKILNLYCETADLTQAITFSLNGVDQGGCIPLIGCAASITQSGTTTTMAIASFNSASHSGSWTCTYGTATSPALTIAEASCPSSQMSTSIAQERTTSVNRIFEFSNITLSMFTGSITPTSDILALTSSYLNTGSTNFSVHTETTNFYSNTETTHFYTKTETTSSNATAETTNLNTNIETTTFYANIETTNVDANTEITEIQTNSLTDSLLFSISGSCFQQISSNTESPLMSATVIDQISYSFKMEDPPFLSRQYFSESTVTLQKISVSSQLLSSIIDTMNFFIYTTHTLITSYLDYTRHSFDDLTDGFQTFSQNDAAAASMSLAYGFESTINHLSLQTTEYHETMQTEFTSYITTPLYESQTDNAATGIYSKEILTSGKSYMNTSVMPSQTQLASLMNDIQESTTDTQSTYYEPYFQSSDEVFSLKISDYLLSTLQSTSILLTFNTKANATEVDSYMEIKNMSTFESQSGIQTMDLSLFTNPSSTQISTVLRDFKTTLLTTTINFNSKSMPLMIKPSPKKTNSGFSYIEIETSFKDSLFSLDSFSGSITSNDQDMTTLSSGVYKSISTVSTNTIQSGLSEKNKNIIFISTTSAVVTIIIILLIVFTKVYLSKYSSKLCREGDNISWSNSSPHKTAFPDYSFTGKRIYPLCNTSSTSFMMHPYEHNWNDIV